MWEEHLSLGSDLLFWNVPFPFSMRNKNVHFPRIRGVQCRKGTPGHCDVCQASLSHSPSTRVQREASMWAGKRSPRGGLWAEAPPTARGSTQHTRLCQIVGFHQGPWGLRAPREVGCGEASRTPEPQGPGKPGRFSGPTAASTNYLDEAHIVSDPQTSQLSLEFPQGL